jgi:hypothetical protein
VAKEHSEKFLAWAHMPTLAAEEALRNGTSGVKENALKVVFRAGLRKGGNRTTKAFPAMVGSTSSEPGMEEAHRAMIVHVEDLNSTAGTLLADLQEMVVRFLREQGDSSIGSRKVYDYTFTFSDGTVFEHTDDSNGDGPGSTIVNVVVEGTGLAYLVDDPAAENVDAPRVFWVKPGDAYTMAGHVRHLRSHGVLRPTEKHVDLVRTKLYDHPSLRVVITLRFGGGGKSGSDRALWITREMKVSLCLCPL